MKLWGRRNSINVQKVLWCLGELGLPFDRVDAGGKFGLTDSETYRRMNPMGLVPVLEDGDLVLVESNAIVRYLCAKYGADPFFPDDPAIRALADRWLDWFGIHLYQHLRDSFWMLIRTPEESRDLAVVKDAAENLGRLMPMFDDWMSSRNFVTGDHFSYGDIPMGAWIFRYLTLPLERPPLPNIEAYFQRLADRPPFAEIIRDPLT